jgi:2-oxoglutarate ferredoxin oxidoreductase subunit gamma
MMIMNEASFLKFESRIKASGDLFLNTSLVHHPPTRDDIVRIEVKANDIAEELGDIRIANMVMLGAFLKRTGVVTLDSVLNALKAVLPQRRHALLVLNEKALRCGGEVCAY